MGRARQGEGGGTSAASSAICFVQPYLSDAHHTAPDCAGKRLRNPFDTITEGMGLNRLTHNFNSAIIDSAFKCKWVPCLQICCDLPMILM